MGIAGAADNGIGITGIAPNARFSAARVFEKKEDTKESVAKAIKTAADELNEGDIIMVPYFLTHELLEESLPPEWFPCELACIQYAAAKGIIVVEAAGNSAFDLDSPLLNDPLPGFPDKDWQNPFREGNPGSGAIIVGAGDPPSGTHNCPPTICNYVNGARTVDSNYGSRVDVQAWGNEVTTSGGVDIEKGDLQGDDCPDTHENRLRWYTDEFFRTSAATAQVAGALAAIQGILKKRGSDLLTPAEARRLLDATGMEQAGAPGRPASERVGNRLNIREILNARNVHPPTVNDCQASPTTLCLQDGRFEVSLDWYDPTNDQGGRARTLPFSKESGFFWFYQEENVEMIVKILDGRSINEHFWVYYDGLTTHEYTLTIKDLQTDTVKIYKKTKDEGICGGSDTRAFKATGSRVRTNVSHKEPDPEVLFLRDGRFKLEVSWETSSGQGRGKAIPLTEESGAFWFFNKENIELVIKVLDGRSVNDHFWVYAASLTDVKFEVTVTDIETGEFVEYENPAGTQCGWTDSDAFFRPM